MCEAGEIFEGRRKGGAERNGEEDEEGGGDFFFLSKNVKKFIQAKSSKKGSNLNMELLSSNSDSSVVVKSLIVVSSGSKINGVGHLSEDKDDDDAVFSNCETNASRLRHEQLSSSCSKRSSKKVTDTGLDGVPIFDQASISSVGSFDMSIDDLGS